MTSEAEHQWAAGQEYIHEREMERREDEREMELREEERERERAQREAEESVTPLYCDFCGADLDGKVFSCVRCEVLVCHVDICDDGCCPGCTGHSAVELPQE